MVKIIYISKIIFGKTHVFCCMAKLNSNFAVGDKAGVTKRDLVHSTKCDWVHCDLVH